MICADYYIWHNNSKRVFITLRFGYASTAYVKLLNCEIP